MPTVFCEQSETVCTSGRRDGEDLWLSRRDAEEATGWALKPEGFCKGPICVPLTQDLEASLVAGDEVNISAFWRYLGEPLAHDAAGETWVLGASGTARSSHLLSLDAPDFSLPDLQGRLVSLSEHRGNKVLLATWASW